jgi:putative membrane protein
MEVRLPHVVSWTNANIFAHLAEGDSLEIQLSRQGASRAQDQAVRDFANRMVSEHSTHLQTGKQLASQAGIPPAPAPDDTADAAIATRVLNRLNNFNTNNAAANGDTYDRRFMRAEVMMHEHMLSDLVTLRSQVSGAAAQLIDQTIPVVQQHLTAAQKVWQQVGGVLDNKRGSQVTTRR